MNPHCSLDTTSFVSHAYAFSKSGSKKKSDKITLHFDGERLKLECGWGGFALPAKGETPFKVTVSAKDFAELALDNKRHKAHKAEFPLTVEVNLKNLASPAAGIPCIIGEP
jgi:cyclopropane fatty-acyl-phospholipid synthase-like methyltransferase